MPIWADVEEAKKDDVKILTMDLALEMSGESQLESVRELILRDMGMLEIDDSCAARLMQLSSLSFSHNKFTSFHNFHHLGNLVELNMNFNHVVSLDGLVHCIHLEKLFLSSNKITSVEQLGRFGANLQTLCLYSNKLYNLDQTLEVLRKLLKLRHLDLDGNPCSFSSSYKHNVIKKMLRLKELDGEPLKSLDRELADEYYEQLTQKKAEGVDFRPSTAPVSRGRAPLGPGGGGNLGPVNLGGKRAGSVKPTSTPLSGPVKLFRSDFLNSNPIMLEYLARDVLKNPGDTPNKNYDTLAAENLHSIQRDSAASVRPPPDASKRNSKGNSFVHRMRKSTAEGVPVGFAIGSEAAGMCIL